jgi:hypothetical protein
MRCAAHPDVETALRCGKCGKPICPRCLVQTPVGARCPDCARLYKLPTFRVSGIYYLRAAGTALGMAILCGTLWGLISEFVSFLYLNLALGAGTGYVTGEAVSRSVNLKRSVGLAVIAGAAVVISYLINVFVFRGLPVGSFRIVYDLVAVGAGVYLAVIRLH